MSSAGRQEFRTFLAVTLLGLVSIAGPSQAGVPENVSAAFPGLHPGLAAYVYRDQNFNLRSRLRDPKENLQADEKRVREFHLYRSLTADSAMEARSGGEDFPDWLRPNAAGTPIVVLSESPEDRHFSARGAPERKLLGTKLLSRSTYLLWGEGLEPVLVKYGSPKALDGWSRVPLAIQRALRATQESIGSGVRLLPMNESFGVEENVDGRKIHMVYRSARLLSEAAQEGRALHPMHELLGNSGALDQIAVRAGLIRNTWLEQRLLPRLARVLARRTFRRGMTPPSHTQNLIAVIERDGTDLDSLIDKDFHDVLVTPAMTYQNGNPAMRLEGLAWNVERRAFTEDRVSHASGTGYFYALYIAQTVLHGFDENYVYRNAVRVFLENWLEESELLTGQSFYANPVIRSAMAALREGAIPDLPPEFRRMKSRDRNALALVVQTAVDAYSQRPPSEAVFLDPSDRSRAQAWFKQKWLAKRLSFTSSEARRDLELALDVHASLGDWRKLGAALGLIKQPFAFSPAVANGHAVLLDAKTGQTLAVAFDLDPEDVALIAEWRSRGTAREFQRLSPSLSPGHSTSLCSGAVSAR